jgi:Domain of unknown function (DUF5658)
MQANFPKWKLIAFALLSASDFLITYLLISQRQDTVYEANPLANHWLKSNGWLGLAVFKGGLVVFVMLTAIYAFYRRPRMAHDLLAISCGAVVVAVLTGTTIAMSSAETASPDDRRQQFRATHAQRAGHAPIRDYAELLDDAARDLAAQRTDLKGAVTLLEQSGLANNEQWLASLRHAYPGVEDRALLAADIVQHAVTLRLRTESAKPLADRLEKQFRDLYGVMPILPYRQMLHLVPQSVEHQRAASSKP